MSCRPVKTNPLAEDAPENTQGLDIKAARHAKFFQGPNKAREWWWWWWWVWGSGGGGWSSWWWLGERTMPDSSVNIYLFVFLPPVATKKPTRVFHQGRRSFLTISLSWVRNSSAHIFWKLQSGVAVGTDETHVKTMTYNCHVICTVVKRWSDCSFKHAGV